MNSNIGIIGAGNMGEAITGALIRSGAETAGNITLADVDDRRLGHLKTVYGVSTTDNNAKLFSEAGVVILAVKPQVMNQVLVGLTEHRDYRINDRKLVISIAAGFRIRQIEDTLYAPLDEDMRTRLPIVRVMPNTPALVLEGMSGMSPNRFATDEDMQQARRILEAMGEVIEFEENQMDAVTAVSGSGPAYLFYLKGAVRLMEDRREPPESLRQKVTSPGGTTAAAIDVLDDRNVRQHIVDAILAARQRSIDLSM